MKLPSDPKHRRYAAHFPWRRLLPVFWECETHDCRTRVFRQEGRGPKQRFCASCLDEHRREYDGAHPTGPTVQCAGGCGTLLYRGTGSRPDPVCLACRKSGAYRRPAFIPFTRECAYEPCSSVFLATHSRRNCCSLTCAKKRADSKRGTKSRERKAIRKNTWDGVPDEAIFIRDRWACQMPVCFAAERGIDPEIRYPDTWSKSVDHVLPLSRGGLDTSGNKRAAHLQCNVRRGTKLDDEDNPPPKSFLRVLGAGNLLCRQNLSWNGHVWYAKQRFLIR